MSSAAHVETPPEQAHTIELNYGGDLKPDAYRPDETIQQEIEHGILVFHLAAQPHQLGLFLNGVQLDPSQTLQAAGVEPGDTLILRQTVVQGG
jgi:hypothetical protein